MAKKKKQKPAQPVQQATTTVPFFRKHQALTVLLVLLALLVTFYNELVFGGKTLLSPDALASRSYAPFVKDALHRGIYPLWNPYLFSGMPSFASLASAPYVNVLDSLIQALLNLLRQILPLTDFAWILLNYLLLGFLVYVFLRTKGLEVLPALFAGIAATFMPQYIGFSAFGHNTKLLTTALIPLIFLLTDRLLTQRKLLDFALLSIVIGLQLLRAHVQVAYYTFMLIGLYFLYHVIFEVKEKRAATPIFTSGGWLAASVICGMLLSAVVYVSVYEYSHYSIRGGGEGGGLTFEYAASWSFHPKEMLTFLVPSFMGFGGETYWGAMPFTDFPLYMGVITLLLAGAALLLQRDRYVIFFMLVAVLSLIISFGKHFPIFYGPMYNYLPFFNKFRVPSMIHILLDFAVVLMAGWGLHALMHVHDGESRKGTRGAGAEGRKAFQVRARNLARYIYGFGGVCAVVLLFLLFGKGIYLDTAAASGHNLDLGARTAAYSKAVGDALKMSVLVGVAGLAILAYLRRKISRGTLGGLLIILLLVDLWWVDFKIIDPKPKVNEAAYFAPGEDVTYLKSQKGLFRIFPIYDGRAPNWYMYHFLQSIYGYHPAKVRLYQEALEELDLPDAFLRKYLTPDGRQLRPIREIPREVMSAQTAFLKMLNTKYVLLHEQVAPILQNDPRFHLVGGGTTKVFENSEVLPRAFFVPEVKVIRGKEAIFNFIRSGQFDPAQMAILEEEPPFAIQPAEGNTVEVTSYDLHDIQLQAEVRSPTLLVLGEVYYPAGWKAYVDGKEQKIYKTNYLLRSIFLEPGSHRIRFVFAPKSFKLGLGMSVGTFGLLLGCLAFAWQRERKGGVGVPARRKTDLPG